MYVIDRVKWLIDNRELGGALQWGEEPPLLRLFMGHLEPIGDWTEKLLGKYYERTAPLPFTSGFSLIDGLSINLPNPSFSHF